MDNAILDESRNSHNYLRIMMITLGAMIVLIGTALIASAATLPSWIGSNMIVTGDEYYNDCTSELGADIVVQSGGNLTFDNVTLNLSASFGIDVQSGGRMYIVDSTLQYNTTTGTPWWILLNAGGILITDNSTLDGYGDFSLDSEQATITNNTLKPESSLIDGIDMGYNGRTFTNNGPIITGNTITQSFDGFYMDGASVTLKDANFNNNTVSSSRRGVSFSMNSAITGTITISGNDMTNVNDDGININAVGADFYHLELNDNLITNTNTYYGIYLNIDSGRFSGNSFEASGNDIQNTDYGMYFYDSYATWGPITINDNNFDSVNGHFVYFEPYGTTYDGDITFSGNTFSNQLSWDESIYFYDWGSWSNPQIIKGDFIFTNNSFSNTEDGFYLYQYYGEFYGNMTIEDNTWDTISGRAFYFNYDNGAMGNIRIKNNNLTDITSYGIYLRQYSNLAVGEVTIINNTLDNLGSYGIYVYFSGADYGNVTIEDNDITAVYSYNIYVYSYSGSMKDVNIKGNKIDSNDDDAIRIYVSYATSIGKTFIQNNTITNGMDDGINIYYYRADLVGDILFVDNDLTADGSSWGDGGSITASYGVVGNVTVERNIVQAYGSYGIEVYLYSSTVDQVRTNNNTFVGNDDGLYVNNAYGSCSKIRVQFNTMVSHPYSGLKLGLYGSINQPIVENNQVVNNGKGIYLQAWNNANLAGGRISNNSMIKNNDGLYIDGNLEMRIEHNKIQSNNQYGLRIWGNFAGNNIIGSIHNNLINNNQVDIRLNDGVTLMSYNNTFDTAEAQDYSLWPMLWVMGVVDVQVLWEEDSSPVGDAELTIEDSLGNILVDDRTDSGGWYQNIEIIIMTVDPLGSISNTPHWINASKFGIATYNEVEVESRMLVTIYLDNLPPAIEVFTPDDMIVTNLVKLKVAGQTEPNAIVTVNGVNVNLTQAGTFEYFVDLDKEGNNDIRIVARDRFNNTATVLLHIIRDTVPPDLEIHTPKEGTTTNSPSLLVEGETEPGAFAKINEQHASVDDIGRFSSSILLTEGENLIIIVVTDEAGNEIIKTRRVFLDSVPPSITIISPESGLITNLNEIEIKGIASGATVVKVNGFTLRLSGETFVSTFKLYPGTNTLAFQAWDDVGNYASYEVVVIQDNDPPTLVVISPKDNMFTGNEILVVSGSSELSNIVTVNGVKVALDPNNGLFQYTFQLREGTNRIIVRSVDPIGNSIEVVRNVFLDTTPPLLTVTNPSKDSLTSNPRIIVEGIVEANSVLTINGEIIPVEQGTFAKVLILTEGENRVLVVATDRAGNKATIIRDVYLDTEASLQIFSPSDGQRTTMESIMITGRVEEGSHLKINGLDIDIDNGSRFTKQFPLDLGTNDFELVVTDMNGNVKTVLRSVVREDVYIPPIKKDVETSVDNSNTILAIAVIALIIAVFAILMMFSMAQKYQRREPHFDAKPMDDDEEDEDLDEDMDEDTDEDMDDDDDDVDTLSDEDETTDDDEVLDAKTKGVSETTAAGEMDGEATEMESIKRQAKELESKGADTTKVMQSVRIAQLYVQKNRREKAKKHIREAKQLLSKLDETSKNEAGSIEADLKSNEKSTDKKEGEE